MNVATSEAASALSSLIEQGIGGVRFEYGVHGERVDTADWIDSLAIRPLWEEAAERHISVGLPHVEMKHLSTLRTVLDRFPTVPVILRRMVDVPTEDGPPYLAAESLLALRDYSNLYFTFHNGNIKAASKGKSTVREFFETFLGAFGADHVMWGSFYPSHKPSVDGDPYKAWVDEAQDGLEFLSDDDKDWLFGETARAVFAPLRW